MDTTDINNILSKKGKQFKNESNQYIDLKGNLNTNDNPFIKASNNQNSKKEKKIKYQIVNQNINIIRSLLLNLIQKILKNWI